MSGMPERDFMCPLLVQLGMGTEGIAPECKKSDGTPKTIPVSMAGLQLYTGEAVNALTFMLNAAAQMVGQSMTINQLRALNAMRCAVTSLGENTWTFLASAYFFCRQFGYQNDFVKFLQDTYPDICTCNSDANIFATYFGGNAKTASIMSACSEAAQRAGIDNGTS